jgi:hypothetical protein
MTRLSPLLIASVVAGAASVSFAGPDDSVWYQRPSASTPAATPTPTAPPTRSSPSADISVSFSYGGDFYYPSGTGYPRVHPFYYGFGRGSYGRYYYPRSYRYYRVYDTPDTSTLIELARRYDPQLLGQGANAEPPSARELGERAMRAGDYSEAISLFAEASNQQQRSDGDADQPDRQAQRLLGIAHAADHQFEQAGLLLVDAFETDASLRTMPIRGDDLFESGLELNSVVSQAVGHAHRHPSYESWFTVAVLMQAQGKNDLANKMIERGEAARAKAAQAAQAEGQAPTDAGPAPDAAPSRREREPETEAERLRRELRESTERLEETKRRLEEIRRKRAESEQGTDES